MLDTAFVEYLALCVRSALCHPVAPFAVLKDAVPPELSGKKQLQEPSEEETTPDEREVALIQGIYSRAWGDAKVVLDKMTGKRTYMQTLTRANIPSILKPGSDGELNLEKFRG